jgi:uncharacterized membrane protein YgcG
MSFSIKPIAASVAIAALLGTAMLASPVAAARADTAANGVIQLAQGYYPYYGYANPYYAYPYYNYGYPYYGYGSGGGWQGGWQGGWHGGGGHRGGEHHR